MGYVRESAVPKNPRGRGREKKIEKKEIKTKKKKAEMSEKHVLSTRGPRFSTWPRELRCKVATKPQRTDPPPPPPRLIGNGDVFEKRK